MTRLDDIDIDALASILRAAAKKAGDHLVDDSRRAAESLATLGESLLSNIRLAQEASAMKEDMFEGADLACVAEIDAVRNWGQTFGQVPVPVRSIHLRFGSPSGIVDIPIGNLHPEVELPAGRHRFVLLGYRADGVDAVPRKE